MKQIPAKQLANLIFFKELAFFFQTKEPPWRNERATHGSGAVGLSKSDKNLKRISLLELIIYLSKASQAVT